MSGDHARRAADLFLEATELPSNEQADFLDNACGSDEGLRAEAGALLAFYSRNTLIEPSGELKSPSRIGLRGTATASFGPLKRRRMALAAAILATALSVVGFIVYGELHRQLRQNIQLQLETVLDANTASVRDWIETRKTELESWSQHPTVRTSLAELVAITRGRDVAAPDIIATTPHQDLVSLLGPLLRNDDVRAIHAVSRENLVILFAGVEERRGIYRVSTEGAKLAATAFLGNTYVSPPVPSGRYAVDTSGEVPSSAGAPQILIAVPVSDAEGYTLAALVVRLNAELELTRRLHVARPGPTGDTYAFDARGIMVSQSDHEAELQTLGLLGAEQGSALQLSLRDPGGDLSRGFVPEQSLELRPLTNMAASATTGASGVDLEGYRDARGHLVVGAWRWLPELSFGIATEVSKQEAYAVLDIVRFGFGGLVALVALLSAYGFASTLSIARLRKAVVEARRLGQYRLEGVIGEGGMAKVYRARHALLQRPVAIKVLKGDEANHDEVARFEREVQIVSRLSHQNTIQIFDYGQTVEGTLFYVMELVPGVTLSELVTIEGPIPSARAIHILKQVCGSLAEAHALGIVHRDIKPGNIMICDRTDGADIVKVLDFGLARTMERVSSRITQQHLLGGTPIYIAPERIRDPASVDTRSDLYSLGAVAYYLLTGKEVVEGSSPQEILLKTMQAGPPPSLTAAGVTVPPELQELVRQCLAGEPSSRPESVQAIRQVLDRLATLFPWTEVQSRAWWSRYRSDDHRVEGASALVI